MKIETDPVSPESKRRNPYVQSKMRIREEQIRTKRIISKEHVYRESILRQNQMDAQRKILMREQNPTPDHLAQNIQVKA